MSQTSGKSFLHCKHESLYSTFDEIDEINGFANIKTCKMSLSIKQITEPVDTFVTMLDCCWELFFCRDKCKISVFVI